jgi:hypothetical protein
MFNRVPTLRVVLVCTVWGLFVAAAQACPTCRDDLAQGPNGNLVRGVFYSILLMMSMPFVILGGLATYGYWLVRRARLVAQRHDGTDDRSVEQTRTVPAKQGRGANPVAQAEERQ